MQSFTVGRGNKADVKIQNKSVSNLHLNIEIINATQVYVQDLQSTNGSFLLRQLGKICLTEKQQVGVSDHLLLGDYQTTVAELLNQLPSGRSEPTDTAFSRYIRREDGQFVRKS